MIELADERMDCDINVQGREGTQTTSFVWNAETRDYDELVGPEVWGDWEKVRNLTPDEALELDCIAGEETVLPKPKSTQKQDREPVVLGTETSVPTAVAAGLPSSTSASPMQPVGQSLVGLGRLTMIAAGLFSLGRRMRGADQLTCRR